MAKKAKPTKAAKVKKVIPKAPKRGAPKQLMTQGDLLSLLRTVKTKQSDMDVARASMGAAIKNAQEKKFLDLLAFSIFKRFERLPDVRLKNALLAFDHYRDIGGLNERAARQLDAFEEVAKIDAAKRKRVEPPSGGIDLNDAGPQMDLSERQDVPVH